MGMASNSPVPKQSACKFEVSSCTKFTKDDCRTIAVTNKRLGTGQTPFKPPAAARIAAILEFKNRTSC